MPIAYLLARYYIWRFPKRKYHWMRELVTCKTIYNTNKPVPPPNFKIVYTPLMFVPLGRSYVARQMRLSFAWVYRWQTPVSLTGNSLFSGQSLTHGKECCLSRAEACNRTKLLTSSTILFYTSSSAPIRRVGNLRRRRTPLL